MMWFAVLAQLAQSEIAGMAGWSSFGIAGLVLAWLLLVRLPAQDKQAAERDRQIKELIDIHLKSEKEQREACINAEREQRHDFRNVLQEIMLSHRTQIDGLGKAIKDDLQSVQRAIDAMREVLAEMPRGARKGGGNL